MRVGDTEIISRPTQVASRNLLVISAAIIIVKYYDVALEDLKIFNVPLPGDLFDAVALVLIGFGIFSLLVHWASDVAVWRIWVDEYRQLPSFSGDRVKILKHISDHLRRHEEDTLVLIELEGTMREIKRHLDSIQRRFSYVALFGRFLIFGYYLIIPIGVAIIALISVSSPDAVALAQELFGSQA